MNRRLLCIVGFCFACTAFWSCAEGDLFSPDEMDEFAVEKITQLGKDGFDSLMALCKDDSITYIASYFDIQSKSCANKILRNGFVIYKNGKIKLRN